MASQTDKPRVPRGQLLFGRLMRATPGVWERLGNLESRILRGELSGVEVSRPIYVTGLARAGTTIVTEMLAAHPDVTSHRYSDFPVVWTPFWWNALRARLPLPDAEPRERAHRDRLRVTTDSPEAVEEVIWMRFFPDAHATGVRHVLDADTEHPRFEAFYREHIRKLLKVRDRRRYLAKGNYNLTRLEYLRRLFPDARFVILVRRPDWHIASLMKQDRLFTQQHRLDPRVTRYLQLLGHYEFGVHKHPINVDDENAEAVARLWRTDEPGRGWARYWASLYRFVLGQLESSPDLAEASLVVPYEGLCEEPGAWIERIVAHAGLPAEPFETIAERYAAGMSPPDYYRPRFTEAETAAIREYANPVYHRAVEFAERQQGREATSFAAGSRGEGS